MNETTIVARELAAALGLAPRPWSETAVIRVLRRWVALRQSSRTGTPLERTTRRYNEPGHLLLACTIAAKVARCPTLRIPGFDVAIPAVEVVVRLDDAMELWRSQCAADDLRRERRGERVSRATLRARRRIETRVARIINRIVDSDEWRRGIEMLGREFSWCARLDPAFRAWAHDIDMSD